MSGFKFEYYEDQARWVKPEELLLECSVRYHMTELEVHEATYSLFATDHRWQVAHRQYKF